MFLGGVAGASVPSTATAAGYYYRITSTGTSQSKTWATGDLAIYNGTPGSYTQISGGVTDPSSLAFNTNARATRGGLAFDGTTNCRAHAALAGQNIGTGDFTLVWQGQISTVAADQFLVCVGPALTDLLGGAGGAGIYMTAAGHLQAGIQASGGYEFRRIANFRTTYGGKEVLIVATRTGGTWKFFINAVDTAHTAGDTSTPMLAASITSTFIAVNFRGTNYSAGYVGLTRDWGFANCVLSQAQITEMQETGAVPEALVWGSQTSRYPSGNVLSLGATDADVATAGNANGTTWTRVAGARTGGAGSWFNRISGSGYINWTHWSLAMGGVSQTYLVRFWARLNTGTSGNGLSVALAPQGGSNIGSSSRQAVTSSWAQYSHIVSAPSARTATIGMLTFDVQFTSPWELDIDDVEVIPLGFVGRWSCDRAGVGLQVQDDSSNKLHALVTTTGTRWTKPATVGYVRALSDGLTDAQQLGGGTILPANCQITRVRARSISGTPSITLGTSSGGSQIVASTALSTTWKDLTIALTGGINTANNSLWMTASAANVVEVQLAYEQLPA